MDSRSAGKDLRPFTTTSFESTTDYLQEYLEHHLNNKMTVIRGNIRYARKMVDELEDVDVQDPKAQKRLNAIRVGLEEALNPISRTLEKLNTIERKTRYYLEKLS